MNKLTKIQKFYKNVLVNFKVMSNLTICKYCGKFLNSKLADNDELIWETCDTCKSYNKWYRKFKSETWKLT